MPLPLAGQRVLVTRAREQAGTLVAHLRELGAEVLELPLIEVALVEGEERATLDAAGARLCQGDYRGLLVGSANAARFFLERLPGRVPASTAVFAIGPATAQVLRDAGLAPSIAEAAISESLLALVRDELGPALRGARLLYPRAREGRDVLLEGLRGAGARVDVVVTYETRPVLSGPGLPEKLDWITFASPSTVRAFVSRFGTSPSAHIACIGPVTAEAALESGLTVAATATDHTAEGLAKALAG